MKAMIFAAGLGTRLRPFTDNKPKALFPVCGKPLLEHVIVKLKASGFNEIIVNVHHFSKQITDFLAEKKNFGIRIEISDEKELLLETGGGIKKAASFFDDDKPLLIHNVDIVSDANLSAFYEDHLKRSEAIASLLVSNRNSSRYLYWDEADKLAGWMDIRTGMIKSPYVDFNPENYDGSAFSGIHILSPKIFEYMSDQPDKFSVIDFYLSIADKTNIYRYKPAELNLVDVGKAENLAAAEKILSLSK